MLRKKFFHSGNIKVPSGTLGFWSAAGTINTRTYNYGSDVIAASTSMPQVIPNGSSAVGTDSQLVVAKAQGLTGLTYKYAYSNAGVTNGTNLANPFGWCTSAGNAVLGIVGVKAGTVPNLVSKYTYAGDVVTAASSFNWGNNGSFGKQGFGIAAYGLFPSTINTATANVNKYTYGTDAITTVTYAVIASNNMSAAGNATFAINLITGSGTSVKKYTYSSDSAAPTTSFSSNLTYSVGTGNDILAVFPGPSTSAASGVYIYSNDTTHDSTSFGIAIGASISCGSNGVTGVNV